MEVVLIIFGWWLVGSCGFIFHWTYDNDFKTDDLIVLTIAGMLGPFSWIAGYFIHKRKPKTLIRKRKR